MPSARPTPGLRPGREGMDVVLTAEGRWISDWFKRMCDRYGDLLADVETGRTWDWGQALCREMYGPDPRNWPYAPTQADVDRAKRWEQGEWPGWALPVEAAADA